MRRPAALLAVSVAVVQADASIVTLALPEVLRDLHSSVTGVAWVLIVFNLVLGVAVIPLGLLGARVDPSRATRAGTVVFVGSTLACAAAPSMDVLIAGRVGQALGGAVVLLGCLGLLIRLRGPKDGLSLWTAAGVAGIAIGPVVGGLLTQALSWRSTFVVQVPLALVALPAAVRGGARERELRERPAVALNVALSLLSAALTAALFLLVLLLVDGFRRSPAAAAVAVSVIPISALAVRPIASRMKAGLRTEGASGCLLVAGGLTALALLPSSALGWTVPAQVLLGFGLGLTVDTLTTAAVEGREGQAGMALGARHLGIVVGLLLLTPVFTADLRAAEVPAQQAIASLVLDAPLPPQTKLDLAAGLGAQLADDRGRVPDLHPAFAGLTVGHAERATVLRLEKQLDDQLQRAAAQAFRNAFLCAAALALAALIPLMVMRP